jgi:N6-L-threonylcarbamoyladenine synthase
VCRQVLSNVVVGQADSHEATGGIVPNVAVQRHSAALPSVVQRALAEAGVTFAEIDAVAVTKGPGMAPCLAVGLNAAKTLAAVCDKQLFPVHHMVRAPLNPVVRPGYLFAPVGSVPADYPRARRHTF